MKEWHFLQCYLPQLVCAHPEPHLYIEPTTIDGCSTTQITNIPHDILTTWKLSQRAGMPRVSDYVSPQDKLRSARMHSPRKHRIKY